MIDLMLDYALYNSCSSCNSGNFSKGAPTNPTWSLLGRAVKAIMDQNPNQIQAKSSQNRIRIRINSESSQIKIKAKAKANKILGTLKK